MHSTPADVDMVQAIEDKAYKELVVMMEAGRR